MEYSIYVNREDARIAEEEERDSFLRSVLESIGIEELDDIWEHNEPLDAKTKLEVLKILDKYEIDIIHDGDRGYIIYVDNDVVGEWFKPRFILKEDLNARKLSKRFYYEMQVKFNSLFEEENEDE